MTPIKLFKHCTPRHAMIVAVANIQELISIFHWNSYRDHRSVVKLRGTKQTVETEQEVTRGVRCRAASCPWLTRSHNFTQWRRCPCSWESNDCCNHFSAPRNCHLEAVGLGLKSGLLLWALIVSPPLPRAWFFLLHLVFANRRWIYHVHWKRHRI